MNTRKVARQLNHIAESLEKHFGDMCDFEFTVEDGKVYVLEACPGKRSPRAAVRIATDLFLEGRITGKTLIERVRPSQIADILQSMVHISSKMPQVGEGLPASAGAATGMVAFTTEAVLRLVQTGNLVIFASTNYSPDDFVGLEAAAGIIAIHGGRTSHEAMIARSMGKPCVVGLGWSFDRLQRLVSTSNRLVREGEYITIDGNTGQVFAGRSDLCAPKGTEDERLMLVLRIIDVLAKTEELSEDRIGAAWRTRDLITYGGSEFGQPDTVNQHKLWPLWERQRLAKPKAFMHLNRAKVVAFRNEMFSFAVSRQTNEYIYLWLGLRTCLERFLARHVGIGRHPLFYRPLFDPREAILGRAESKKWGCGDGTRIQLVGEEFFSINHYVPEYIEIQSIRIYWATECTRPQELWRLDQTNPAGEKLLEGGRDIVALKVVLNDAVVPLSILPRVYNFLRGREYFSNWYDAHETSRHELMKLLAINMEHHLNASERELLRTVGLLSVDGQITKVGHSLLHPDSARERAKQNLRIGW